MGLPKIDLPIYEVFLPSNSKEVMIKPFTVKDEKILLMAADSDDENTVINAVKQVLKNCVLTEDIDIEKLPFFDIDYLFIALRAKSIGEAIEMQFVCNAVVPDDEGGEKQCKSTFNADIDISAATVDKREDISITMDFGKDLSLKMRYPTYTVMKQLGGDMAVIDRKIQLIAACIEYIVKGDDVYSFRDYTKEEMVEFVEGLTEEQFKMLAEFVDNFPSFSVKLDARCPKCGFVHKIRYKDFASFFQ